MASYNQVILIGNLTKDPELKYTSGGAAEGIKSEKDLIARMESEREQKITAIWMMTELSEARQLVESALE